MHTPRRSIRVAVSEQIGKGFVARTDFNELEGKQEKHGRAAFRGEQNHRRGLQAADKDIEAVRKEAAEYKAKAEQAEKDAAEQLESYKFNAWFDGLAAQNHGRDGAVIRTLAGTERMDALRKSQNWDEDGKALFNDLLKNSAYALRTRRRLRLPMPAAQAPRPLPATTPPCARP